jgi:hypothetical protein
MADTEGISDADRRILRARYGFVELINVYFDSTPAVLPGSDAARDSATSGSDHIPNRVVEGFVASVVDRLRAWYQATAPTADDARPFLYIYADYTLWRAILEALACAVWILGPEDGTDRITCGVRLAKYEWSKSKPLERAHRSGDESMARLRDEQERVVRRVCATMKLDFDAINERGLSPSTVVNAARDHLGAAGRDLAYWWMVCSRYAHAQTLTVMHRGIREREIGPNSEVLNVTTDAAALAELVEFGLAVTDMLVGLLRRRGFERCPRGN